MAISIEHILWAVLGVIFVVGGGLGLAAWIEMIRGGYRG